MAKSADAFRTISEVAEWLGVQTHVLRFWESKFTQVKPVKRAGGRRYYRPADMLLLGGIRKLLHDDGLTIKGVQKILREEGMAHVADMSRALDEETEAQLDGDLVARISDDLDEAAPATPPQPEPEPYLDTAAFVSPTEITPPEPEPEPVADVVPEPVTAPPTPMPGAQDDGPEPLVAAAPHALEERGPFDTDQTDDDAPVPDEPIPSLTPDFVTQRDPEPEPAEQTAEVPPQSVPDQVTEAEPVSFATDPDLNTDEQEQELSPLPAFLAEPLDPAPEVEAEADSPRARVVDAPDDPVPDGTVIEPSALTKVGRIKHLTPEQATSLRPLVAQLMALRDQMSGARRDPR